ncbi:MAG: hypothetical protein FH756_01085 [Firmicutes bacterium]|nr:hypothetical protein [Bacillota bacterium]
MVILLWLIVSAYFFSQHFYTVRRIDLNEKVITDNGPIRVEEIVLTNVKRDYSFDDPPWYHDFAAKHPSRLTTSLMKVFYFYSTPYEVNKDFGRINVKGFLVSESPELDTEGLLDLLDIDVTDKNNSAFTSGEGLKSSSRGNVVFFESYGDNFPFDIDIFKVDAENEDDEKIWELTFNQTHWESHTYNDFFTPKPPREEFETERKLTKIYYTLRKGSKEEIEGFMLPNVRDEFPWGKLNHQYWASPWSSYRYLNYEGEYQEYRDVYTYNLNFRDPDDRSLVAQQKIYLIYKDGVWKIINVGSLEEVGLK